jgi:hypothetical protein
VLPPISSCSPPSQRSPTPYLDLCLLGSAVLTKLLVRHPPYPLTPLPVCCVVSLPMAVFAVVTKWLAGRAEAERQPAFDKLAPLIRYPQMSGGFLVDVVGTSQVGRLVRRRRRRRRRRI